MENTKPENRMYKNLFVMLVYSYDKAILDGMTNFEDSDINTTPEFLAYALIKSLESLQNVGLINHYKRNTSLRNCVVGRLNIKKSITTGNFYNGKYYCDVSRINDDTLENQYIKMALNKLVRSEYRLSNGFKKDIEDWLKLFNSVSDTENIVYEDIENTICTVEQELSLNICRMVLDDLFINEDDMLNMIGTNKKISSIFESFLRNYYISIYGNNNVSGHKIIKVRGSKYLNISQPDITIKQKENKRTMILDAKYYKNILIKGNEYRKSRIHASNQNQIENYVHTAADNRTRLWEKEVVGVLVYAKTSSESVEDLENGTVAEEGIWSKQGVKRGMKVKKCRLRVIDMCDSWEKIEEKLNAIVTEV